MPPAKRRSHRVDGARAIPNIRLECDWCGNVPSVLYLPDRYAGVFCEGCIDGVLNPPRPAPPQADDRGDYTLIIRKLNAFLKDRPAGPAFCGRGRPRKKPDALDAMLPPARVKKERKPIVRAPMVVNNFKYFARGDTVRIVGVKSFRGVRAVVWGVLLDGPATIGEVLTRCEARGLGEKQAVSILRKMASVYHCLKITRAA